MLWRELDPSVTKWVGRTDRRVTLRVKGVIHRAVLRDNNIQAMGVTYVYILGNACLAVFIGVEMQ